MASRGAAKGKPPPADASRSEKLLAILVLEALSNKSDRDKAVLLSGAGFTNQEVGELLRTSPHVVGQHLYASRQKKKLKGRPAKKTTARR